MASISVLIMGLVALAGIGFIAGIFRAVRYSLNGTPLEMPNFLRQVVTGIGGVLATNLGAVLGIEIEQAATQGFSVAGLNPFAGDMLPGLQIGAAWLYVIGLLIALFGWWRLRFTEEPDKVVVTLPQLSQTFLGVVVGVLAVALGSA